MLITPEYVFKDVTHITPEWLAAKGITALVLDIDNTLTADRSQELPEEVAAWLAAMRKAGAEAAATGENPVIVACRTADIIVGPIGILVADAMLGEITEKMTLAISRAGAKKVLLPVNQCGNLVAGTQNLSLSRVMEEAVETVRSLL